MDELEKNLILSILGEGYSSDFIEETTGVLFQRIGCNKNYLSSLLKYDEGCGLLHALLRELGVRNSKKKAATLLYAAYAVCVLKKDLDFTDGINIGLDMREAKMFLESRSKLHSVS